MSRVGKKPIPIPSGVKVKVGPDTVDVEGPKGKLSQALPPGVRFEEGDGVLQAFPVREGDPSLGKFHGLGRSLVANAVTGVSEGFKKELDIVGMVSKSCFHLGIPIPFILIFLLELMWRSKSKLI